VLCPYLGKQTANFHQPVTGFYNLQNAADGWEKIIGMGLRVNVGTNTYHPKIINFITQLVK
jgi:hypothetical protein